MKVRIHKDSRARADLLGASRGRIVKFKNFRERCSNYALAINATAAYRDPIASYYYRRPFFPDLKSTTHSSDCRFRYQRPRWLPPRHSARPVGRGLPDHACLQASPLVLQHIRHDLHIRIYLSSTSSFSFSSFDASCSFLHCILATFSVAFACRTCSGSFEICRLCQFAPYRSATD